MRNTILLISIFLLSISELLGQSNNVAVPFPNDCTKFAIPVDGPEGYEIKSCYPGLCFNPIKLQCDFSGNFEHDCIMDGGLAWRETVADVVVTKNLLNGSLGVYIAGTGAEVSVDKGSETYEIRKKICVRGNKICGIEHWIK